MFDHSVPVNLVYRKASKILQNIKENGHDIVREFHESNHRKFIAKQLYLLVTQVLRNFFEINTVLEKSKLLEKESRLNPWIARVLLYEMLWNNKELKGQSKPVQIMNLYYDELASQKEAVVTKVNIQVEKPRFVRVNTLKTTVEETITDFRVSNWILTRPASNTYEDFLTKASSLEQNEFMVDIHVEEMLVFPPKTYLQNRSTFTDKLILLQDKASCLPVNLLNPQPGSVVLDMCAAPGMKTTFLAAKMKNKGTIYAVERDEERFKSMNEVIQNIGATCIKTIHKDALKVTSDEYPNVEYILVDPSCSGSGMTKRIVASDEAPPSADRLKRLSGLQIILLKHALGHFPKAQRVVYSTCSTYTEENECVVEEVLKCNKIFKLLSARNLLEGKDGNEVAESITDNCLNFRFEKDLTNGFFIAVFERKSKEEIYSRENDKVEVLNQKERKKMKYLLKGVDNSLNVTKDEPTNEQGSVKKEKEKKKQTVKEIKTSENEEPLGEHTETVDTSKSKKKKKKKRKNMLDIETSLNESNQTDLNISISSAKHSAHKKRKHNNEEPVENEHHKENINMELNQEVELSKKKKHKSKQMGAREKETHDDKPVDEQNTVTDVLIPSEKKKRKNKSKAGDFNSSLEQTLLNESRQNNFDETSGVSKQKEFAIEESEQKKKSKKKKHNKSLNETSEETVISEKKEQKVKHLKLSKEHNDDGEPACQQSEDVDRSSSKKKKRKLVDLTLPETSLNFDETLGLSKDNEYDIEESEQQKKTKKKKKHNRVSNTEVIITEETETVTTVKKTRKVKHVELSEEHSNAGEPAGLKNEDVNSSSQKKKKKKVVDFNSLPDQTLLNESAQSNLNENVDPKNKYEIEEPKQKRKDKKHNMKVNTDPAFSDMVISEKKINKVKQLKLSEEHGNNGVQAGEQNEDVDPSPKKKKTKKSKTSVN